MEIKRLILDMPQLLTEEYYVPDYCCGRIIGRGGSNIKEMSIKSNCKIKLLDKIKSIRKDVNDIMDNANSNNATDGTSCSKKIIALTGSFEQIISAKVTFKI